MIRSSEATRHRATRRALALALFALVPHAALAAEPYRYSREVRAAPGWSVLALPDDVLAAARPGLPDLRLSGADGEIAFVLEERLAPVAPRIELHDLETDPRRETRALLDRGESPARCSELTLEIAGDEPFLKPLVVEASPDGKEFSEIARGSIFRVASAEMPRIRFAPNDRRFLRVRLDDSGGVAVRPLAARCLETAPPPAPSRELALAFERVDAKEAPYDSYLVHLPSENLAISTLRLAIDGAAFSRSARVYERLLFRDEISRRLVGGGRLERSATGRETTELALGELTGSSLEIEIDRAGPALAVSGVKAAVAAKRLVFVAPETGGVKLVYGSPSAPPPRYDLAEALRGGRPSELAPATLGAVKDSGQHAPLSVPTRGPKLVADSWLRRTPIVLPEKGPVAYLDLERSDARDVHQVRIVDAEGRQVPYLVEAGERPFEKKLRFGTLHDGVRTIISVELEPEESLGKLVLRAKSPSYFERDVTVSVPVRDTRGPVGERELARLRWEKRPEAKDADLAVPLTVTNERSLVVAIFDGENPPLELAEVIGTFARRRIDFVFSPGDKLELLSGNVAAYAPRYDLALIAATVLASPASRATLAAQKPKAPDAEQAAVPKWFWWVAVGSGLLVVLALARARK